MSVPAVPSRSCSTENWPQRNCFRGPRTSPFLFQAEWSSARAHSLRQIFGMQPLPALPYDIGPDGQLVGGPTRDGVLWSHVRTFAPPGYDRAPNGLEGAEAVFGAELSGQNLMEGAETQLSYSAIRDELYALVRAPGGAPTLSVWHGRMGQWQPRPLRLSAERSLFAHLNHGDSADAPPVVFGAVMAMTFSLEHDSLFVVDRPVGEQAGLRLLRIGLLTGMVDILVDDLVDRDFDVVELSAGWDATLLLAAAQTDQTRTALAHLQVLGDEVTVVDTFEATEPPLLLAGGARDGRIGVQYLASSAEGFRPRLIGRDDDWTVMPPGKRASSLSVSVS